MVKKKFDNYGLLISITALVGLLLKDFGLYPTNFESYVTIITSILICLGIISNPNQGKWYKDK